MMDTCTKVKRYGDRLSKFPSDLVDEGEALRCLEQLNRVTMTTSILEETKVGRVLNEVRKSEAVMAASSAVCRQCKDTIRRWKSLVMDGSMPQPPVPVAAAAPKRSSPTATPHLSKSPAAKASNPTTSAHKSSKSTPNSKSLESRPNRSLGQATPVLGSTSLSMASRMSSSAPQRKSSGSNASADASARSPPASSPLAMKRPNSGMPHGSPAKKPHLPDTAAMLSSPPKTSYVPPPPSASSRDPTLARKPHTLDQRSLDVGQRSHDKHTIYSGRKRGQGGEVPSLFTLSMRVLIDNMDYIEETYLPFQVLEPILEKASAAQLTRIESFNEQIVEDTEKLWQRHCMRDFRGAAPRGDETWRECYSRTSEEKSNRLQHLTARIKKTTAIQAKEDAKHTAKLTEITRAPGKRSSGSSGWRPMNRSSSSFSSGGGSSSSSASGITPLMAKTKKMMQARRQMTPIRARRHH